MSENGSVTIFDVAKLAGVSPSTVSRVMRNSTSVRVDTAEKVLKAANTINYKQSKHIDNDSKKNKNLFAVVIPDLLDPFFINSLKGILDQASLYDSHIVVYNSDNNPKNDKAIYDNLMSMEDLKGLILIPSGYGEDFYKTMSEGTLPIVFLDRQPKEYHCSSVTTNDYDGALQATKHLITLGHRNLIYFGGRSELSTERNRLKGFSSALKSANIEIDPNKIIESDFNFDSAYSKAKKLLQEKIEFTAAFAANDLIAMGIKLAFEEEGFRIPDDLSIVGYGDISFARYISLTTVSSPSYELGKNAFLLLYNKIENRINASQRVVLRPSLIIRETCKYYQT